MEVVIVGTGYVGLATGTCLTEMGHNVSCVDIDQGKIENLNQGIIPIYEPGLESLIASNVEAGRLRFTTSLDEATVIFIAVGTPPREDGSANIDYVLGVAAETGRNLEHYTVIADKSTVPVGTAERVHKVIERELQARNVEIPFDVVSNPEFLKEGAAIHDFMRPDRIVVGSATERAAHIMEHLYKPFNHGNDRVYHNAVVSRNAAQKQVLFNKLSNYFHGELGNLTVALWGLAFKPGTDDMREATSVTLVEQLVGAGVRVRAHDPVAMDEARRTFPDAWFETGMITLLDEQYETLRDTDALILVTEWNAFRNPDWQHIHTMMRHPLILDGRNIYDYHTMTDFGFEYVGIGRSKRDASYIANPMREAI